MAAAQASTQSALLLSAVLAALTSGCFPKPVDITRDIRPGNGAELTLPFKDPVTAAEFAAGPETLDALWLAPDAIVHIDPASAAGGIAHAVESHSHDGLGAHTH